MKTFYKSIYILIVVSGFAAMTIQAKAQNPPVLIDSINFDQPGIPEQIIEDSSSGDWQIGMPHKAFFNTAASPPNAIMTDTLQPFTPNTTSSFIVTFPNYYDDDTNFLITCNYFCFDQKLESIQGKDFGQVDISKDGGHTWYNFTNDPYGEHITFDSLMGLPEGDVSYNNVFQNHWETVDSLHYGFTGTIAEYTTTCIHLVWVYPVRLSAGVNSIIPDSVWLKFTFVADSNLTHKAGWIIDNIRFYIPYCPSGLAENKLPPLEIYPLPADDKLTIITPETISGRAILSVYDVTGRRVYTTTLQQHKSTLNTSLWVNGLYTYRLVDKQTPINVGKIIINH